RSPLTLTRRVSTTRRAWLQLWPGSRARTTAATVCPSWSGPRVRGCEDIGSGGGDRETQGGQRPHVGRLGPGGEAQAAAQAERQGGQVVPDLQRLVPELARRLAVPPHGTVRRGIQLGLG